MGDDVAFCPKCGAPAGPIAADTPAPAPVGAPMMAAAPASGLAENVAGMLCYVLGWLTGLIFLLTDKRRKSAAHGDAIEATTEQTEAA